MDAASEKWLKSLVGGPKGLSPEAEKALAALDASMSWFPGMAARALYGFKHKLQYKGFVAMITHPSLKGSKSNELEKALGTDWETQLKTAWKELRSLT
jgi:hypothetical protein